MTSILFLVFGLAFGSFLGMLTYRLPRNIAWTGRSFCDSCKRKINWYENIPFVSYLIFRKCKTCNAKIPARYPIIEGLTAVFFLATGHLYTKSQLAPDFLGGGMAGLFFLLLVTLILISLAVIDFEHQILPDELTYVLGFLVIGILFLQPSPILFTHSLGGFLAFIFFLTIYLATRRRGMGFGDIKLAFVLGSFLGFPYIFVWLFASFVTGSVVGVILLVLSVAKIGHPIPFGPFLIFSFWATIFFGRDFLNWYMGLM